VSYSSPQSVQSLISDQGPAMYVGDVRLYTKTYTFQTDRLVVLTQQGPNNLVCAVSMPCDLTDLMKLL
jgi:hypothetical protein